MDSPMFVADVWQPLMAACVLALLRWAALERRRVHRSLRRESRRPEHLWDGERLRQRLRVLPRSPGLHVAMVAVSGWM